MDNESQLKKMMSQITETDPLVRAALENEFKKEIELRQTNRSSNSCPICNNTSIKRCRCPVGDSECSNGHHWHHCPVHGNIINGKYMHNTNNSFKCLCIK